MVIFYQFYHVLSLNKYNKYKTVFDAEFMIGVGIKVLWMFIDRVYTLIQRSNRQQKCSNQGETICDRTVFNTMMVIKWKGDHT